MLILFAAKIHYVTLVTYPGKPSSAWAFALPSRFRRGRRGRKATAHRELPPIRDRSATTGRNARVLP